KKGGNAEEFGALAATAMAGKEDVLFMRSGGFGMGEALIIHIQFPVQVFDAEITTGRAGLDKEGIAGLQRLVKGQSILGFPDGNVLVVLVPVVGHLFIL
ncbi:MAG: hypothetical protein D3914_08575, partial [Candidatus Electrothrix sp. LOE2]|nr:hypothetical protein [Candidatus Electrothrix sp. LOE2]